ncbi:MAG TPA: MBL fold metallo-hydrolase [Actinomycetota bacterium]|nr:MBL fold metallo-hydrolase [Actinomycetota bacterium]
MSTTADWFATRELEPGTWLIAEPTHVNSYVVAGRDRAVLIDSGLGIGDIRSIVQSLTPLDVLVANTHHHWDHVGGNGSFSEVAIHEVGAERLRAGNEMPFARAYLEYTRERLERFGEFRDLDRRYFDFLSEETTPRPLPDGFDPAAWKIPPCEPSRLLRDGDVLDLGGRSLRVMHTPGHTHDSVCYLDAERGLLFGGDTYNTGAIYAQMPDSDLEAFAASTARLEPMADDVRSVYMAHFTRYAEHGTFLREVADGFAALMAGDVRWEDVDGEDGEPIKACWFARFGVYARPEAVAAIGART